MGASLAAFSSFACLCPPSAKRSFLSYLQQSTKGVRKSKACRDPNNFKTLFNSHPKPYAGQFVKKHDDVQF